MQTAEEFARSSGASWATKKGLDGICDQLQEARGDKTKTTLKTHFGKVAILAEAPSVQAALAHCDKYELATGHQGNTEIYRNIIKSHRDLQIVSFDCRQLCGSNGIFFLGDTGVGKSTLANAMMHGHKNMQWVKKEKEPSQRDIERAKKTGKDPKPKMEKVLELAKGLK